MMLPNGERKYSVNELFSATAQAILEMHASGQLSVDEATGALSGAMQASVKTIVEMLEADKK